MPQQPLVSVIMPAYNCANYVNQAIDSILNQSYQNFELLVADDGSKDDTKLKIDAYSDSRIKTFHNSINQGYLVASNLLMEKATGEYIMFQDADDFCALNRIEILLAKLQSDDKLYAVGSNAITVDENGKTIKQSSFPLSHEEIMEHFCKYRNPIVGSALMFKREVLKTIGLYNLYFNRIGYEDYYWYSLIVERYKVANVDSALYYYRANPDSVSNKNRSFKSFYGFETIVYYLNERLNGRSDDIASGNLIKINLTMGRFYLSTMLRDKKKVSFMDIFSISDNFWVAIRLYLFKLKKKYAL